MILHGLATLQADRLDTVGLVGAWPSGTAGPATDREAPPARSPAGSQKGSPSTSSADLSGALCTRECPDVKTSPVPVPAISDSVPADHGSDIGTQIVSILFGDVVGFSKLTEPQVPVLLWSISFGLVATLLAGLPDSPLKKKHVGRRHSILVFKGPQEVALFLALGAARPRGCDALAGWHRGAARGPGPAHRAARRTGLPLHRSGDRVAQLHWHACEPRGADRADHTAGPGLCQPGLRGACGGRTGARLRVPLCRADATGQRPRYLSDVSCPSARLRLIVTLYRQSDSCGSYASCRLIGSGRQNIARMTGCQGRAGGAQYQSLTRKPRTTVPLRPPRKSFVNSDLKNGGLAAQKRKIQTP